MSPDNERVEDVAQDAIETIHQAHGRTVTPCYEAALTMLTEMRAAEERGRRAGIEEAAKFVEQFDGCMHGECFAEGVRALAPRDSGKEQVVCDCDATLWGGGHSAVCATVRK